MDFNFFSRKCLAQISFGALYFILMLLDAQSKAATLLTESVGSIRDEALTSRESELSAVIESWLSKKNESWPLSHEQKIIAVNTLLLDKMVEAELNELKVSDDSKKEFDNLWSSLEKEIQQAKFKESHWLNQEIKTTLIRKLRVRSFLKTKADSFVSLLNEQDLLNYYEKNQVRFGGIAFQDVKENIRSFLLQTQKEERIKTWVEVLKKKYKAKNYLVEKNSRHG